MTAPELDAPRARLLIAPGTFATLVAHTADPVTAALEPGAPEELARLQEAGVIDGGRVHPALAGPLAAIVAPSVCALELAEAERVTRAWVAHDAAALVVPPVDGDARHAVIGLHPTLVPGTLARLVGLGPRPRPAAPGPVAPSALKAVARRWRLTATWPVAAGAAGSALEIADAADGLWAVAGEQAEPTDPTTVWRAIVRAVMRREG